MPQVTIACGTKGSGKTELILQRCRERIEQDGADSVLLLAPNARRAAELREALLEKGLPALFDDRITTFPHLADLILTANHEPAAEIGPVTQRLILRQVLRQLAEAGRLEYLGEVRDFPGFVGALADFIGELKRAAVDTETFAAALKRAGLKADRRSQELAAIYRAYQQQLHELSVFDEAGGFWWAREVLHRPGEQLSESLQRLLGALRLLLVDGFDDFTTTELDVLELLARAVEEAVITLPLETEGHRPDLFAVPLRTLGRLRERFPEAQVRQLPPAPVQGPLGHLGQVLFARPVRAAAGPEGAVRVIEVAGLHQEAEEIARECKRLIVEEGVPAGDIAVAFRRLPEYSRALRGAFRRLGVPLHVAAEEPADRRPIVQPVLAAYAVVAGDYGRASVLALAKSSYVELGSGPAGEVSGDDLDFIARRAGIVGGREAWEQRLEVHQRRLERELERVRRGETTEEDRGEREVRAEQSVLPGAQQALGRLFQALESLRAQGTLAGHVQGTKQLIGDLGIGRRVVPVEGERPKVKEVCAEDVAAFAAFFECLDELAAASGALADQSFTLAEYQGILRDALGDVRYQPEGGREGRVLALDAHQCRQLRCPYVIIGGLTEREFPLRRQESPFYDDEERRRLRQAGAPLETSGERQQHEALLFWSVATSATEQLILTYPTTDAEGKEILTSYYVDEVLRCFEGQPERRQVPVSRVVPELEEVACVEELLERALLDLWQSKRVDQAATTAAYNACLEGQDLRDVARNALIGALVETERDSLRPFGECDGMIGDEAIQQSLGARYPPGYRFSASQFGEYGSCPIAYLFKRVFGLEPLEEPVETVEALERGRIYHEILGELFPSLQAQLGSAAVSAARLDQAREIMQRLVADYFQSRLREGIVYDRALWQIEQEECGKNLLLLLEYELQLTEKGHRPLLFEAGYGMRPEEPPLAITGENQQVLVRGRIDRVDSVSSEQGEGYAVLDYKLTGGPPASAVIAGRDFQLPIYAMAAKLLGPPGECVEWFYYRSSRPPGRCGAPHRKATIEDCLARTRQFVVEYAGRIRRGEFPPSAQDCSPWCEYRAICRHDRWRTEKKTRGRGRRAAS